MFLFFLRKNFLTCQTWFSLSPDWVWTRSTPAGPGLPKFTQTWTGLDLGQCTTWCLTSFPWNPLKELNLKSGIGVFKNILVLKSLTDITSSGHALKNFMWEELICELGKPSIHPLQGTTKTE